MSTDKSLFKWPDPCVLIRPEKGTDNWQYIVSRSNPDGECKSVDGIHEFSDDDAIEGVWITGFEGKEKQSDKWQTVPVDFVRKKLIPFIKKHLSEPPRNRLDVDAECSSEINMLFKIWNEEMATHPFTFVTMSYCGVEAELYLNALVKTGHVPCLRLVGAWPMGGRTVVMNYLASTKEPILGLNKQNRIEIDKELFDLMIDKFIKGGAMTIRFMYGDLKVPQSYLKAIYAECLTTPSEQGNATYTWKSPFSCRWSFQIQYRRKCCLKVGVEVTSEMLTTECYCPNKHCT